MRLAVFLFTCFMGAALAVSVPASDAQSADVPVAGSPPVGMNFGVGGGSIPKGNAVFMINYRFADSNRWFRDGRDHTAANPFGGSNQKTVQNMFALKLRYGLGNGWDIRGLVPVGYIKFNEKRLGPASSAHGIGDSNIVLHKEICDQQKGAPITFGVEVGALIPTGSTNRDGLGTGAWGALAGIAATYAFNEGRQLAELEGFYFYRGSGGNRSITNYTYRNWGDYIWVNARYVYVLTRWLDIGIESQFAHYFPDRNTKAQVSGIKISNMKNAATSWFAGPAATLKIPAWSSTFGIGLGISVYQNYQAEVSGAAIGANPRKNYATSASLGAKWRIEAAYSFAF